MNLVRTEKVFKGGEVKWILRGKKVGLLVGVTGLSLIPLRGSKEGAEKQY